MNIRTIEVSLIVLKNPLANHLLNINEAMHKESHTDIKKNWEWESSVNSNVVKTSILIKNVFKLNGYWVILLSRYILSIETAEEVEEYVGDLLQGTDGRKRQFIDELLSRWKKTQRQATDTTGLFLLKESVSSAGRAKWCLPLNVSSFRLYIKFFIYNSM